MGIAAEINKNTMHVQEIFSQKPYDLDEVICALMNQDQLNIVLGFIPLDSSSYAMKLLIKHDTTLFVRGKNILKETMFPVISHT